MNATFDFNQFGPNVQFIYIPQMLENQRFSDFFREVKKWNIGLKSVNITYQANTNNKSTVCVLS